MKDSESESSSSSTSSDTDEEARSMIVYLVTRLFCYLETHFFLFGEPAFLFRDAAF